MKKKISQKRKIKKKILLSLIDQNLDSENEIINDILLKNLTQSSDGSDLLNELEREI